MYKQLNIEITGACELMLCNIRRADPTDRITKEIKKVTSKRTKTESDFTLIKHLEWLGALYTTKDGPFTIVGDQLELGDFGNVCIRGNMIEACLIGGAKKNKLGVQFKAGMFCDGDFELDFPNRKPAAELYGNPTFSDTRPVKLNGKTTIFTTRAFFPDWSLKFQVSYLPDLINRSHIEEAVDKAGQISGIGAYRPRYGRFDVKSITNGNSS